MAKKLKYLVLLFVITLGGCTEPSSFVIKNDEEHAFSDNLIYLAQFSDDAKELAMIDEQRQIAIWDIKSKNSIFNLSSSQTPQEIRAFYYKKNEKLLLIASSNYIEFWDVAAKEKIGNLKVFSDEPLARISALSVSEHCGLIAVGMTDGTLFLYNRSSNTSVQNKLHESTINFIYFDASARYILTSGLDGKVNKSGVENLEVEFTKEFKTRISALVYDEHTQYFFVSDVLDNQSVFEFGAGRLISKLDYTSRFRWFRGGAFIDNRQYLLTTSPKTSISMWRNSTGKEVLTWDSKTLSLGSTNLDLKVVGQNVFTITSEGVYQRWSFSNKNDF